MVRFRFAITLLLIAFGFCAQAQSERENTGSFEVIIGLSATHSQTTAAEIKDMLKEGGLSYMGYCNSQECVILKASMSTYKNGEEVFVFLKQFFGNRILGVKDYPVSEFYKNCSFLNEGEYQYFKKTYGK